MGNILTLPQPMRLLKRSYESGPLCSAEIELCPHASVEIGGELEIAWYDHGYTLILPIVLGDKMFYIAVKEIDAIIDGLVLAWLQSLLLLDDNTEMLKQSVAIALRKYTKANLRVVV